MMPPMLSAAIGDNAEGIRLLCRKGARPKKDFFGFELIALRAEVNAIWRSISSVHAAYMAFLSLQYRRRDQLTVMSTSF